MKLLTMIQAVATGTALFAASQAGATSVTNTMTNTVVVANACDVVAIGVDFGTVTSAAALTLPVNLANTNDDTGASHDDTLSVTTGVSALDTAIAATSAVTGLVSQLLTPGVYVECTQPPTSVTLGSVALSTALGASAPVYTGSMAGPGSGTIQYKLTMVGAVVNTSVAGGLAILPTLFTGAYVVGTSQITGSTGTIAPGRYTETVTATVTY